MNVPAQLVKQLRDKSGVSFMLCKKALLATEGDIDKAIEWLREQGEGVAQGKSSRAAAEGAVLWRASADACAMVEVNCETDSVARLDDFKEFCERLLDALLAEKPASLEALMALDAGGSSFEERRQEMVSRIGENIQVRRFELLEPQRLHAYIHGGKLLGVAGLDSDNDELGHDMAMQVVASQPEYISVADVPEDLRERERGLIAASLADSDKPEEIKARIVEGKLNKQLGAMTIEEQPYLKDNKKTVKEILKQQQAKIVKMRLWRCGEGIDKPEADFAAEVKSQAAAARRG